MKLICVEEHVNYSAITIAICVSVNSEFTDLII